jgi:hypothetical protein
MYIYILKVHSHWQKYVVESKSLLFFQTTTEWRSACVKLHVWVCINVQGRPWHWLILACTLGQCTENVKGNSLFGLANFETTVNNKFPCMTRQDILKLMKWSKNPMGTIPWVKLWCSNSSGISGSTDHMINHHTFRLKKVFYFLLLNTCFDSK